VQARVIFAAGVFGQKLQNGSPSKCASYVVVRQAVRALLDDMHVAVVPEQQVKRQHEIVTGRLKPESVTTAGRIRTSKEANMLERTESTDVQDLLGKAIIVFNTIGRCYDQSDATACGLLVVQKMHIYVGLARDAGLAFG
jgi:hypothetical protein